MSFKSTVASAVALALSKVAADRVARRKSYHAGPGRKSIYTAWKNIQNPKHDNKYNRTTFAKRQVRTDALVTHEIKRATRWIKSNDARLVVAEHGTHKGQKAILAKRRPPAHIEGFIREHWDLLCE